MTAPRIPGYVDRFLDAVAAGAPIEHVHLGHWDAPETLTPDEARRSFTAAQTRMSERLIRMLSLRPGMRALDVGCGLGGTARLIRRLHPDVSVIGLNLDARQLAVARRMAGSDIGWVLGDACRLPFADASLDRVLCVEAAFHFASRDAFFAEARRVLRPRGRLVMSDVLFAVPASADLDAVSGWQEALEADYGPWPEKRTSPSLFAQTARERGFTVSLVDATAQTSPSYHTIAPRGGAVSAGARIMRALHDFGVLRYVYVRLDRDA